MTTRRLFLRAAGATVLAPAIVRAESLMRLAVPRAPLLYPLEVGQIDRFRIIRTAPGFDAALWSGLILAKFERCAKFGQIVSRDYPTIYVPTLSK